MHQARPVGIVDVIGGGRTSGKNFTGVLLGPLLVKPDKPIVSTPSSLLETTPPHHDGADLTALLTRVADGDSVAFAQFYDLTSPRLFGLVLRIVRGSDHAAEVTQEVYLQIWAQASRFEPSRGSVWAWITTLAHRRAVDRVRTVAGSATRDHNFAARQHVCAIDEVWENVSRRIDALAVRDALLRLSPKQREALTLAYFEGRTSADIAASLDIAISTVKTRIRDGLINLRTHLVVG